MGRVTPPRFLDFFIIFAVMKRNWLTLLFLVFVVCRVYSVNQYCDYNLIGDDGNTPVSLTCAKTGTNTYKILISGVEGYKISGIADQYVEIKGVNGKAAGVADVLNLVYNSSGNGSASVTFTNTNAGALPQQPDGVVVFSIKGSEIVYELPTDIDWSTDCVKHDPTAPKFSTVTATSATVGEVVLQFSLTGDPEPTMTVKLDGVVMAKSTYTYADNKLTIKSNKLTEGSHTIVLSATNGVAPDATVTTSIVIQSKPACDPTLKLTSGSTKVSLSTFKRADGFYFQIEGTGMSGLGGSYVSTSYGQVELGTKYVKNTPTLIEVGPMKSNSVPVFFTPLYVLFNPTEVVFADVQGKTLPWCDYSDPTPPSWNADPVVEGASARTVSVKLNASDDMGVAGFEFTLDGCAATKMPVELATIISGTYVFFLPEGCDDLTDVPKTLSIKAYDKTDNYSSAKTVQVKKTCENVEPVVSCVCGENSYSSISFSVKGAGDKPMNSYIVGVGNDYKAFATSDKVQIFGLQAGTAYTYRVYGWNGTCVSDGYYEITCYTCSQGTKQLIHDFENDFACKGAEVHFTAVGFCGGESTWEYGTSQSGPWTKIDDKSETATFVFDKEGTYYVHYKNGTEHLYSKSFTVGLCCEEVGSTQVVIWKETFEPKDAPSYVTEGSKVRYKSNYTQYKFAPFDSSCGEAPGKVCDDYYVVVTNSTDANASLCGWPGGKFDHTSGNGTSGFMIINAGIPEKVIYEQEITPAGGFCTAGMWYNFSLYATNIAKAIHDPARFLLEIVEKRKDGSEAVLNKWDTGNIKGSEMQQWYKYGTTFSPSVNVKSISVRVWNKGASTEGNDIVLDDLQVSVCQPKAQAYVNGEKSVTNVACGSSVSVSSRLTGYEEDYFPQGAYYLWLSNADGAYKETPYSGVKKDKFDYPTMLTSKPVKFYCIIATDRETALKIFNGQPVTDACKAYAVTDEISVKCDQSEDCQNPPVITLRTLAGDGESNQSVCSGDAIKTITYTLENVSEASWTKDLNGLSIDMASGNTSVAVSGTPTATTMYNISVKSSDVNCQAISVSGTITVNPNPTFEQIGETQCSADMNSYSFSVKVSGGELIAKPVTSGNVSVDNLGGGNWSVTAGKDVDVKLTVKAGECTSETTVTAPDCECPDINLSISASAEELTCKVKESVVTAVTDLADPEYFWSTKEAGSDSDTIKVSKGGDYSVYVASKAAPQCKSATESVTITENIEEDLAFTFKADKDTASIGGDITATITITSGNAKTIEWYANGSKIDFSELEYSEKLYKETTYQVRLTGNCNTPDPQSVTIKVVWPTIITPYVRDGYNDDFIVGLNLPIKVFDRNGNMVYEGGDGLPMDVAQDLMPAVYFYVVSLPEGDTYKGTLELYKNK